MKILIDHPSPFLLAHGGAQIQIEQTKKALEQIGVEVEWLRWWDAEQKGDVIHYFGVAPMSFLQQARAKKIPVVMTNLFTATCNRSDAQLRLQGWITKVILGLPFGEGVKQKLHWRSFAACSRNIVGLAAEQQVLKLVHDIPAEHTAVVPLGLPDIFIDAGQGQRTEDYLICAGTITERKNCVPLARMALQSKVPILFVGKPYSKNDPYWLEFQALVDGGCVRHQPHVSDSAEMISILLRARGAVVMSWYENWCLTAHEAAACGLPLLLPDQKWSRERFGEAASYFSGDLKRDTAVLRDFYERCPTLPAPKVRLFRWIEVAQQLKGIYETLVAVSVI